MTKKKELFLEEAVLDDLSQNFDSLEVPLSERAFKLVIGAAFLIVGLVVFKIFFLGWLKSDFYKERALANAGQITVLRAERGIIFDRFNKPLVKNQPSFRLSFKLAELLKNSEEKYQTIEKLSEVLNLPPNYIEDLLKEVNLERQNSLTIATDLSVDDVIKIKNLNLPAVQIEDDFNREYKETEIFSQLIGYVGPVSKNDLKEEPQLSLNDTVGKSGLEAYYDQVLRGEEGETIDYRNVKGEIIENKLLKKSEAGDDLHLTIDAEFQSYFYNRLKEALNYLGSPAGVGIALNPQNGELLALLSLPSFDNNEIKAEDFKNPFRPFFNRAISGVYTPGSTVKPLVAFAALKEKTITPQKEIFSPGYLDVPNPYHPDKPTRFLDWKPQGWVNLYSAIARSSDVYFYEVGGGYGDQKGLGIEKLKEYWQKFGFGQSSGIDLFGENKGFLPDPETKEKNKDGIWRLGDTYNVSIGQGDLLVTPIQLINYIAAIANGGKIYQPFIVKKIISEDGKTTEENEPKVLKDYSSDSGIIKEVQKGMIEAVAKPYGTAYLLADLPFSAAAKTGTSQIENNKKINAFFVGYAPAENPQIAILVLVEDAKEGSINTIPVANDVLRWYYKNRLKQ